MKLQKLALASALVFAFGTASAFPFEPLFIDVGNDLDSDGNSQTSSFNNFTLNEFFPQSNYFDTDGSGTVSTGDVVIDIGAAAPPLPSVLGLNPTFVGDSREGFGTTWGIDVEYALVGVAVVSGGTNDEIDGEAGETLGGQFNQGTINFLMNDPSAATTFADGSTLVQFANIESEIVAGGAGISLDLSGDVVGAAEDFLFFAADGADVNDELELGIEITAFADSELDSETLPVAGPAQAEAVNLFETLFGSAAGIDTFTRTTEISSLNVEIARRVPAPATIALLGIGLLGVGRMARRRVEA